MASQKLTAAEVLDMLENVTDDGLECYQEELEQESGSKSPAFCDYTDEDGQQVLVDSDLRHPSVTSALRRINEDVLPCEMDSLLLCDTELREDDAAESDSSMEDEPVWNKMSQLQEEGRGRGQRQGRGRGQRRGRDRGQRRGRGRGQRRGRGRGQRQGRGRGQRRGRGRGQRRGRGRGQRRGRGRGQRRGRGPQLVYDLQKDGTYCSGTVRSNRRNFPKDLKRQIREKSARGDIKVLYHDSIIAVHWFDKRDVLMLSAIFQDETVIVDRHSGHSVLSVTCPKIVQDYNAFMGGVDAADQHMVYYSCGRRGMKFWRRIAWRLLDLVVLNSHVLYNLLQEQKCKTLITQKEYRIAHALLAPMHLMVQGPGHSPRIRNLDCLKGKHFASNKQPRKRCAVCAKKRTPTGKVKDTKTSSYCQKCDVYLCKGRCFQRFHTLVKY